MLDKPWLLLCLAGFAMVLVSCSSETATIPTSTTQGAPADTRESTASTAAPSTTTDDQSTTTMASPTTGGARAVRVMVFHKTEGFTHQSIGAGIRAFEEVASALEFEIMATDDSGSFTADELAKHDVVVFLNTTGDVLNSGQEQAMEGFVASGGGFIGIHSATDTEYDWPWYGGLVATYFDDHPAVQPAVVDVVEPTHPIVAGLTPRFERTDEWYNFRGLPGPDVTVLMTVDESTYEGGSMGELHPIAWAQEYAGGRAFYTGFGHTSESFEEPMVRRMLANAILWVAGE